MNKITLDVQVLEAIRRITGPGPVSLHEPSFLGNELNYLAHCLESTHVASIGKFVGQFEDNLTDFTGAKYAVAVVNGTAALHIALKLAGVEINDEVLMPALTFVATANAVRYCNAIPHFIDSDSCSLGVNITKLREYLMLITRQYEGKCINKLSGRIIRALIPMHTFGHPADLDGLLAISSDFNIPLVEDAAESLGSIYHGKHTGTFGLLGVLSFNGNKVITTGGGGVILTNDMALARKAKHITSTAKLPHQWEFRHDEIGYNYRMPNLNAALGCAQLEQLGSKLQRKRKLFELYKNSFSDIEGIKLVAEPAQCSSNYWLQTLLLEKRYCSLRDEILKKTNDAGIMTRPAWVLINQLPPFINCPAMNLDYAQSLVKRIINIPSSPSLVGDMHV